MIKITIDYEDFDDVKRSEPFWFHLSQAEIAEWHLTYEGSGEDLVAYLKRIVATEERKDLIAMFKGLIVRSIGRRSDDGRRFEKSQAITDDFMQTNAYSEFFMRLSIDAEYAVVFFKGIMPKELVKEALKGTKEEQVVELPAWEKENRPPTKAELIAMDSDEIARAMRHNFSEKPLQPTD